MSEGQKGWDNERKAKRKKDKVKEKVSSKNWMGRNLTSEDRAHGGRMRLVQTEGVEITVANTEKEDTK